MENFYTKLAQLDYHENFYNSKNTYPWMRSGKLSIQHLEKHGGDGGVVTPGCVGEWGRPVKSRRGPVGAAAVGRTGRRRRRRRPACCLAASLSPPFLLSLPVLVVRTKQGSDGDG